MRYASFRKLVKRLIRDEMEMRRRHQLIDTYLKSLRHRTVGSLTRRDSADELTINFSLPLLCFFGVAIEFE